MKENTSIRIERYGLDSVPVEQRQTKWYEYTMIQAAFSVNAGNFLVPALAVLEGGLSILQAIISTTLGAALAFLFVSYLSGPGAKHGIPAQFAMRSILGTKGAQWVSSPVRTLTSLYWFSVQTIGGTFVLKEMLDSYSIYIPFTVLALILAAIMAILALVGFTALKKVTKQFFPVLLLGQVVILYIFLKNIDMNVISPTTNHGSVSMMLFFASLAFVQYVSGVSSSSDVTRYAKSYKHGFYGLYIGNVVGFIVTAVLGSMSAGYFHNVNPFVAAYQLTDSLSMIAIIFICAMLSMISINLNNAYTGGFSLLNSIPLLGRVKAALLFGLAAVLLSAFPELVANAKAYISLLGAFIIPLSSIIVMDYLILKRGNLLQSTPSILPIRFNRLAFVHIIVGIIIYFFIPESFSPGFITFLLSGLSYVIVSKLKQKKNSDA